MAKTSKLITNQNLTKTVSKSKDPLGNFNFRVIISGGKLKNITAGFNAISGLGVTVNYKEYREGGNNGIPDKLVESIADNPVTFMKGVTKDDSILDIAHYYLRRTNGTIGSHSNRFTIKVQVMDKIFKEVKRTYTLHGCQLETFNLGDLSGQGAEVLVESFSVRFNSLSVK